MPSFQNRRITLFSALLFPLLLLLCLPFSYAKAAMPVLPSDLRGESIPFLPYLEYVLDEKGTLDIETLSLQEKSLQFQPLRPLDLELNSGAFWLRFTIGPLAEGGKPVEWLLSLGESLPGDPQLYVPDIQAATGMQQWQVKQVTDRHILTLPEASNEPRTCYIRMAGPPGLWFAPMLRSPHNAANNWGALAHPAAVLGLFVIMLLCLCAVSRNRDSGVSGQLSTSAGPLLQAISDCPLLKKGTLVSTILPVPWHPALP